MLGGKFLPIPFRMDFHGLAVLQVPVQEGTETESKKNWTNSWSMSRYHVQVLHLSQAAYLYLALSRVTGGRKKEAEVLADVRELPRPRRWQGRNWELLQSSAGWVERLSK